MPGTIKDQTNIRPTRIPFAGSKNRFVDDANFTYDADESRATFGKALVNPQYTRDTFEHFPKFSKTNGFADPTGVAGDENLMVTEQASYEYHILGTQTILSPAWSATGLDIGMDQVDNDGVEVTQGITARGRQTFVVGTDGPFFFEVEFSVADVSGSDDCAVGFRKAEAYQANIDDYDEMAALNLISGDVKIETILNAAGTTTTDTTDNVADGVSVKLRVIVSAAGVVTYEIDGAAPTVTAAFTFDDGEVIVPFMYFLHASDVAGAVPITKWECGLV